MSSVKTVSTPSPPVARRGTNMRSTTTARSWKRRIANVARPCLEPVSDRSCMIFITTAVLERASAPPIMIAAGPEYPAKSVAKPAIASVDTTN
jgi:hypothetical protein